MKRAIATFALGGQADLLEVSAPTFARFAAIHGYGLFIPTEWHFNADVAGCGRPYSWWKIPLLLGLLETNDEVLWLDADVVIRRFDEDIPPATAAMRMTVHHTADGAVPNCGVWHLRRDAVPLLKMAWGIVGYGRSACWWEQAAVIAALGGDPDATPVAVPPGPLWSELPYEWNPHRHDARGIPADCRFFHSTMFPDRRAAMEAMLR